jgi:hypothetical protein
MKYLQTTKLISAMIVALFSFLTWAITSVIAAPARPAASAAAQERLPFGGLLASEEFSKTFGAHQFTPFGDSKFTFTISIPNSWESHLSEVDPDQIAHDTEAPVPIAEFYPSGADDVGINVQYIKVAAEKPLGTVIDEYAKANDGKIETRQQLEFKGHSLEDALMKNNNDDLGPMLTRVTLLRRGAIVFIYTGWSVEEKYERYKRLFGAALESFTPAAD